MLIAALAAAAVLQTEARWMHAIEARDARTLSQILARNFEHVTYRGAVRSRNDELRAVRQSKPYHQRLSGETVDFAGDAAIVHGINTISADGSVVLRLRFTDVFVYEGGRWQAVSAQETAIYRA